jgi:hypothetical protein
MNPRLAAAALLLLLASRPAAADPYGEPPIKRSGLAIGGAAGAGLFKGVGAMDDIQGVGGDLNLRIGTPAAANLLWLVEFTAGGYLVEVTDAGGVDQTYNALTTLTFGGQLYLREALWLRGGVGFAGFVEREGRDGPVDQDSRRAGLGFIAGGGYDFFRRGHFALSVEYASTLGVFRSGPLGHAAVLLGLTWY